MVKLKVTIIGAGSFFTNAWIRKMAEELFRAEGEFIPDYLIE